MRTLSFLSTVVSFILCMEAQASHPLQDQVEEGTLTAERGATPTPSKKRKQMEEDSIEEESDDYGKTHRDKRHKASQEIFVMEDLKQHKSFIEDELSQKRPTNYIASRLNTNAPTLREFIYAEGLKEWNQKENKFRRLTIWDSLFRDTFKKPRILALLDLEGLSDAAIAQELGAPTNDLIFAARTHARANLDFDRITEEYRSLSTSERKAELARLLPSRSGETKKPQMDLMANKKIKLDKMHDEKKYIFVGSLPKLQEVYKVVTQHCAKLNGERAKASRKYLEVSKYPDEESDMQAKDYRIQYIELSERLSKFHSKRLQLGEEIQRQERLTRDQEVDFLLKLPVSESLSE